MAIFKYRARIGREDMELEGTVAAKDEVQARAKLRSLDIQHVHLRKLNGFSALLKRFTVDIK